MFPAWSPDGLEIAFYGGRDDSVQLFVVPATGGEPRQLTTGPGSRYFPQWSLDGSWLYYASGEGPGRYQIFRMPAGGGNPEQVTTSSAYYYRWSHDGTRVYFPGNSRGSNNFWERTLADGHERRVTRFIGRPGSLVPQSLAANQTHLYFSWRHDLGDVWVMEVVADEEQ
jgi:TolB protein